jgi:hypothetical protein
MKERKKDGSREVGKEGRREGGRKERERKKKVYLPFLLSYFC